MKNKNKNFMNILILFFQLIGIVIIMIGIFFIFKKYKIEKSYNEYSQRLKLVSEKINVINQNSKSQENFETLEEINKDLNRELLQRNNKLKEINEDYVGWLNIFGTEIDFPVVLGRDNVFYLTHNHEGIPHEYGAIFMDYRNTKELNENHILIYGHHTKNNQMFSNLTMYLNKEYLINNDTIEFISDNKIKKFKIFSVQILDANIETFDNPKNIENPESLYNLFKNLSAYEINDKSKNNNQILSLVTCDFTRENSRLIVHGTLISEEEIDL